MIAAWLRISPRAATELAANVTAVTCCGLAWRRTRGERPASNIAAALTVVEGLLLLDLIFNWRWALHSRFVALAMRWNLYGGRRGPQTVALGLLAVLLLASLRPALRFLRWRAGAFLAVVGVLLSLVLWCTEVISLHALDHVLYRPLGELTVVSVVRVLPCLMTSVGISVAWRARRGPPTS